MSEPLLRIRNHHSPACGAPQLVEDDDPALYVGYFENAFGEQWVFTYHRKTRKAERRVGDVGWNTAREVKDGRVDGLVLGKAEAAWRRAGGLWCRLGDGQARVVARGRSLCRRLRGRCLSLPSPWTRVDSPIPDRDVVRAPW
jgi:hypothetical protein